MPYFILISALTVLYWKRDYIREYLRFPLPSLPPEIPSVEELKNLISPSKYGDDLVRPVANQSDLDLFLGLRYSLSPSRMDMLASWQLPRDVPQVAAFLGISQSQLVSDIDLFQSSIEGV